MNFHKTVPSTTTSTTTSTTSSTPVTGSEGTFIFKGFY